MARLELAILISFYVGIAFGTLLAAGFSYGLALEKGKNWPKHKLRARQNILPPLSRIKE